jgi:hypothetical protein
VSRVGDWLTRAFGATVPPDSPDDLLPLRDGASIGEVQVLAAKLHANGVPTWVSSGEVGRTPPLPWPTTRLPAIVGRTMASPRASLYVRRADVRLATALLDQPSPFE